MLIDVLRGRTAVGRLRELRVAGDRPFACAINVEEIVRGLRPGEEAPARTLVEGLRLAPLGDVEGYLQSQKGGANLFFQLINARYERAAIILTSNKAFSDWAQVFAGDAVMASAALDRLLHRCTIINIRGESFRLKEKRQAARATLNALLDTTPPSAPATPSAPPTPVTKEDSTVT